MRILFALFTFLAACGACAQPAASNRLGHCNDPKFDGEVASWLRFNVPAIDVDSLKKIQPQVFILDAREPKEFAVSHLEGAVNCGYDHFDKTVLDSIAKDRPIVVYCSIGYRSEKIARKLQKMGYNQVSNLYGSIFEWVNRGYAVVDEKNRPTPKIHTYNKSWSRWVDDKKSEKIY
jgi:rhodanese-related sulfurtransferase